MTDKPTLTIKQLDALPPGSVVRCGRSLWVPSEDPADTHWASPPEGRCEMLTSSRNLGERAASREADTDEALWAMGRRGFWREGWWRG